MDHNPYLKNGAPMNADTGRGRVEDPAAIVNVPWQTRPASPTEFELALCDALTEIFDAGAEELSEIVAALNDKGVKAADGSGWTIESFQAEMKKQSA
ncbi:MAG: hypothetical protein GKS01_13055 [Alphaproteobacteria bacterium]|nr:hypothetical protein [Alphaproteobacteria bacterium]